MFNSQETLTVQVSICDKWSFSSFVKWPSSTIPVCMFNVSQTVDLCPESAVCLILDSAWLFKKPMSTFNFWICYMGAQGASKQSTDLHPLEYKLKPFIYFF